MEAEEREETKKPRKKVIEIFRNHDLRVLGKFTPPCINV